MTPVRNLVARSMLAIVLLASSVRASIAAAAIDASLSTDPTSPAAPAASTSTSDTGTSPTNAPPPGAPSDDVAGSDARRLYEEGLDLYRRGDYAGAIAKLDLSYAKTAAPGLLYDLAQAHRLNGDCARALEHYRRFLASEPTGMLRERTLARITEMNLCTAAAPVGGTVPSPPPPISLAIAAPKAPAPMLATRALDVEPGRETARDTDLRSHRFRRHRTAALVGGATTLGLAALAGYFAWRTNDAANDVSSTFQPGKSWDANGVATEQRGQTSYKLEIGAAIGALIAGGISAWLVFRD